MTETTGTPRALSAAQLDGFRRTGYISIGRVLDDETLQVLRDEYDRAFDEARDTARYRNLAAKEGAAQRHDKP